MNIAIISLIPNQEPLWIDEFVKPIEKILNQLGHNTLIIPYHKTPNTNSFDKIIISGSPLGDFEANANLNYFKWIKNLDKPLLGICGGMQILTQIYSSELKNSLNIGLDSIKPTKDNPLISKPYQVYQLHAKTITPNKEFEIIAKNNTEYAQAIKHKTKPFYGVLFHPEVRNQEVILNFLKL